MLLEVASLISSILSIAAF